MFIKFLRLIRSLQWRLVFIFVLISIALTISVSVFLNYFVGVSYYDTFKNRIETGFSEWESKEFPTKEEIIKYLKDDRNAIILFAITQFKTYTVIDKSTNEIVFSTDQLFEQDRVKLLDEIQSSENYVAALSGQMRNKGDLLYYGDRVYFDYAREKGNFIIYFRYDREEWKGTINKLNNAIWMSLLIAIIASIIVGYFLSKTITKPIVDLMRKSRKMASGDFGQVLIAKSDDEIGKLTKSFNFMSNELKKTLTEISKEKNKIETILYYMTDGVVAFNIDGEITHANPASKRILEINKFDISFNEFSSQYDLGITLENLLNNDISETKESTIKIGDRFIKIYFVVFTDKENNAEGILCVIHDITAQQKLENMRRDFVANVSHELRTPLTSIKSYAETLIDGAIDDKEITCKFLGVINSEADRMTRLVKDLLQLSRLDNGQMQFNMQEISLVDIVNSTVEKMRISAKNNNQELNSFCMGEVPNINADRDRIEQVIVNILSNAIKYTPKGGSISVYIGSVFDADYIKIVDSGLGIPKEDLPRIFERFYRVDKARSREMGGTGLGLSIAKDIVEAHNGSISISSEFGKGTEVLIKIPMCNSNLNPM